MVGVSNSRTITKRNAKRIVRHSQRATEPTGQKLNYHEQNYEQAKHLRSSKFVWLSRHKSQSQNQSAYEPTGQRR
jgi:hypothetical protein